MKPITISTFFVFFLTVVPSTGFSDLNTTTSKLSSQERLNRSVDIVRKASSENEIAQSLGDLVQFAHLIQDSTDAILASLDDCANKFNRQKTTNEKLTLAKAQLLAKIGRWDEAKALFDNAISENYDKAATTYLECLTSIGKNKERAIEEFNLCVGKPTYLDYRGRKEDLSVFTTVLLFARHGKPEFSAMKEVFPYLVFNDKNENLLEITRALCLAADGQHGESLKSLQAMDAKLANEPAQQDLYKTLPLYVAWTLFDEGNDAKQARDYLQVFYDRNQDDRGHALGRILRIAYYYERYADMRHKIVEVTEYLLNSEMFTNSEIRAQLNAEAQTNAQMKAAMPADLYAHVLELHASGLSWKYDWQNAVKIWDLLIQDYYPQTVTGASALMSKAVYIASKNNPEGRDAIGALDYLDDILKNARYDAILPHVLQLKSKYLAMLGRYPESRVVLKELFDLIPPNPTPEFQECLAMAKSLEKMLPQLEEYKRMDDEHKALKEKRKNETREEAIERIRKEMDEYYKSQQSNQ